MGGPSVDGGLSSTEKKTYSSYWCQWFNNVTVYSHWLVAKRVIHDIAWRTWRTVVRLVDRMKCFCSYNSGTQMEHKQNHIVLHCFKRRNYNYYLWLDTRGKVGLTCWTTAMHQGSELPESKPNKFQITPNIKLEVTTQQTQTINIFEDELTSLALEIHVCPVHPLWSRSTWTSVL